MGQQIRTLEGYLGRKLFERRPTGVVPTAAALRVQDRLTGGMSILSDVIVQLSCMQVQDRVAVTLPESFAENWLTLRHSDFYRDNAGVDLRLDSTNRQVDLFEEDFDFAIRYAAPPKDNLTSIKLFDDSVLPVCTPDFAAEYGLSPGTRVLADIPLIHLVNRTPDPDWVDWPCWADAFGVDLGNLSSGPTFSRFNSGLRAAVAGQGLVLCGIVEAFHAIEDGQLVVPFGFEWRCQTSYRYWLVHVEGRRLSKVQRKFVSCIGPDPNADSKMSLEKSTKSKLRRIERDIEKLFELHSSDAITSDAFKIRHAKLEKARGLLEKYLEADEQLGKNTFESAKTLYDYWHMLNPGYRHSFVEVFVDAIKINGENITFCLLPLFRTTQQGNRT